MPFLKDYLNLSIEAAHIAGEIQKRSFGRTIRVDFKGPKDLVTEVDQQCEEAILKHITKNYPDHNILSEEGGAFQSDSPFRWIIDPLDGTTNYAHGYPFFCVSIALEQDEEIILGIAYNPMMNELFTAIKGEGSFLNGTPIHVSGTDKLEHALLATGRLTRKKENMDVHFLQFQRLAMNAQATRRDGSAVLDLCYVAAGRFDGFWESGLNPWDSAAGSIIIKESGGEITNFTGRPFNPFFPELLASNGALHQLIMETLNII